ncbi:FaeA/PapI family transcriptional regulator [Aeromonas aquatica]|uniref:FaeA/PapI family transcriptional regulator n=1 Tax=Aeromonas aquatica TaxID=558964 RepID=UPI0035BC6334
MAKKINRENVYDTLMKLCRENGVSYCCPTTWPKTRDVADICGINIYSARLFLIDLEKEGIVLCTRNGRCNSLYWHIVNIKPDYN